MSNGPVECPSVASFTLPLRRRSRSLTVRLSKPRQIVDALDDLLKEVAPYRVAVSEHTFDATTVERKEVPRSRKVGDEPHEPDSRLHSW